MNIFQRIEFSNNRIFFISAIQLFTLVASFMLGILSYRILTNDTYANWIVILTVINSVFVLTSYGNDIFVLKSVKKEDLKLSVFSDIFSYRILGVFFLSLPIISYLLLSIKDLDAITVILFYLYLFQKLYIDVLSSYFKLTGRFLKAIILTLIFDLILRIGVVVFINQPSLKMILISLVLLNTSILLFTPLLHLSQFGLRLRELGEYLRFNWPLYFNSFVVFLVFNIDILMAPKFLSGKSLAGYLFTRSMFLAGKALIDVLFENKVIELAKAKIQYLGWVRKFLFLYYLLLLFGCLLVFLFFNSVIQFISEDVLQKVYSTMPFMGSFLVCLIFFPLFRHYYAYVLVFCNGNIVKKSNYFTIVVILLLVCGLFYNNELFIYLFPLILILFVVWHVFSFVFGFLESFDIKTNL